jgi:hypothetical protein
MKTGQLEGPSPEEAMLIIHLWRVVLGSSSSVELKLCLKNNVEKALDKCSEGLNYLM